LMTALPIRTAFRSLTPTARTTTTGSGSMTTRSIRGGCRAGAPTGRPGSGAWACGSGSRPEDPPRDLWPHHRTRWTAVSPSTLSDARPWQGRIRSEISLDLLPEYSCRGEHARARYRFVRA
jgi:hypothetical protein